MNLRRVKLPPKPGAGLLLTLFLLVGILVSNGAASPIPPGAVLVGNETCANCHTEISEKFHKTNHGTGYTSRTDDNIVACESCHGPGSAHVDGGDPALILNPARDEGGESSDWCRSCHGGMDGLSSLAHHEVEGNCASCHQVHVDAPQSLKQESPALCYDCHSDIKVKMALPSRHPVGLGFLNCLDCHDIHGTNNTLTVDESPAERCITCHTSKQGPFVFEHAPVTEDCGICHDPHGTVADNLLKQNEPFLCLSCHPAHFHTTIAALEGDFVAPLNATRTGVSTHDGFKRGMLTKCTQCHSDIHGTDMPAQSITGSGALTR